MATNKRKRKKKSARARQRQRLLTLVALVGVFVLVLIVAGMHLYQEWEARYESDTSIVFVEGDGTIITNDVVAFDTDKYSTVELELFVDEAIDTYNRTNGEDSVVKESLVVENNVASLILKYADVDTYKKFTDAELFVGSIAQAVAAGYTFDGQFVSIIDGKAIETSVDKFYGQTDVKVVIIKANTKVQVDGEILYLSAENVAEFGENWIITRENTGLLEQGDPDVGQSTESETNTDSELSDGSVDGTELVTEEEETGTEIIFDFGDEDVPTAEDTYSEVYTYIIYK